MAENEGPGSVNFKVTPPNFDVTTAPQEELDTYGIPRWPDPVNEPDAFARWTRAFPKGFKLIKPELRRNPDRRHGPVLLASAAAGTTNIWSGAVVTPPTGKTFASVEASWTVVPVWAEDAGTYYMSSWIGIDGYGGVDVLQAGIEHDVTEPGAKTNYYLWYEWFPDVEIQIQNLKVKPGDEIHCTVTSKSTTSANVIIGTNLLGVSIDFQAPAGTTLQGNCAEWIVERPTVNNSVTTLPHYHTVWFGSTYAYDGSSILYDLSSNLTLVSMVDGAQTVSVPAEMDRGDLLVSYATLWQAAFQANTGDLWISGNEANPGDMHLGMMKGTSPSITAIPGVGWQAAFQANTGNLWVVGTDPRGDMQLGMMKGTSPSITALTPLGRQPLWQAAFQANTGNLWVVGTDPRGDMQLGMMAGTSPSITAPPVPGGGWEVAFQANTGNLWVVGTDPRGDMQLGMMAGTSPSITALSGGGWEVAFQANTGNLWVVGTDPRGDLQLGMMAGTSPSITALSGGGWEVAFQANTGNLWVVGTDPRGDLQLGMMAGTSPSITALSGGGWEVAFQANTGNLWVVGDDDRGDMKLGMMAGTSPSIAR